MKLTDIVQKGCVRVPLESKEKSDATTELIDLLHESGQLTDRDDALRAVLAREQTRSTGIGLGLAVPHGKSHGSPKLAVAIGKPVSPMEFEAIDGRPCSVIVLLTSPVDETGPHIQALASISRLWQDVGFRAAIIAAKTGDELFGAIKRHQP